MKKHALLLLSMLLTLSLAACGNDAPADETEVDQLPEQEITETVGNAEETAAQTEAQKHNFPFSIGELFQRFL